jgi:hypothetical protein
MAVASKESSDPMVLDVDRRTCACMGRTFSTSDFDMLLSFTELFDSRAAGVDAAHVAALAASFHLSETELKTNLDRIRAAGRVCLQQPKGP